MAGRRRENSTTLLSRVEINDNISDFIMGRASKYSTRLDSHIQPRRALNNKHKFLSFFRFEWSEGAEVCRVENPCESTNVGAHSRDLMA